jgi:hypothetical protein
MSDLTDHRLAALRLAFLDYAEHHGSCQRWTHMHKKPTGVDRRAVCDRSVCTCGVVAALQRYNPSSVYTMPCPDADATTTTTNVVPLYPSEATSPNTPEENLLRAIFDIPKQQRRSTDSVPETPQNEKDTED